MQDYTITGEQLQAFRQRLVWEEKSPATIEKYLRDAAAFTAWLDGRADPEWLRSLLSVLPRNTYTLEEWNEALSQAAGRRIFCPSYRTLSDYLHRLVLGVQ